MQGRFLSTLTRRIWPGRISIQNLLPNIHWVIQQHDTEVWQEQPWRGNRQLKRSGEKLYIKLMGLWHFESNVMEQLYWSPHTQVILSHFVPLEPVDATSTDERSCEHRPAIASVSTGRVSLARASVTLVVPWPGSRYSQRHWLIQRHTLF